MPVIFQQFTFLHGDKILSPYSYVLLSERRKQITSVKPGTLEGSQGQLCAIVNNKPFVGSGTLCCFQGSGEKFVLACAHVAVRHSVLNKGERYSAESAAYHLGKVNEHAFLKESVIDTFYIHPGYGSTPHILDGCDLAFGLLPEDFAFSMISDDQYLSYVEKEQPKPRDIIRVIGYPGEKNGCLYEWKEQFNKSYEMENTR